MTQQYQTLEPNRGIYKNMRFPIAPFIEYPKWVDVTDPDGTVRRIVVKDAAEERTVILRAASAETKDAPTGLILERNELAQKVTELSQALAEAKAQPEMLMQEMAKMREQMNEMSKQLLAMKSAPAPAKPAKGDAPAAA